VVASLMAAPQARLFTERRFGLGGVGDTNQPLPSNGRLCCVPPVEVPPEGG
jgi:hypothetical protein